MQNKFYKTLYHENQTQLLNKCQFKRLNTELYFIRHLSGFLGNLGPIKGLITKRKNNVKLLSGVDNFITKIYLRSRLSKKVSGL